MRVVRTYGRTHGRGDHGGTGAAPPAPCRQHGHVRPDGGAGEGPIGLVQAADREIAKQTAAQLRALAAFAQSRPFDTDRQQGEKGAMSAERWAARPELLKPVSEWAAQELSIALSITQTKAEQRLHEALTIVTK